MLGVLPQEAVARVYAGCDIFAFPSLSETIGNVVGEAMACGLPVVLPGGARTTHWLASPGEDGLVVARDTPEGWAVVLAGLLDDPRRRGELGKRAAASAAGNAPGVRCSPRTCSRSGTGPLGAGRHRAGQPGPDDRVLTAVTAALAAGACFALAGVLQQQAAARRPAEESLSFRLLASLVREPLWLAGIALAFLAYAAQAVALASGPLSLVQPLIVSELVFAVPLSARLYRMRLGAREWLGTAAVTCGLLTGLLAARPRQGSPEADPGEWLLALGGTGALAGLVLAGSRKATGPARASLIALAGGAVMGSQSVLLDATVDRLEHGITAVFTSWEPYLLVVTSVGGLLLIQSAFQAGPLSASMPVIDATEPAVAITVGVALFGENPRVGPGPLGLATAGAALLLAGIVLLDTSPLLSALYDRSHGPRTGTAEPGSGTAGATEGGGPVPEGGDREHRGTGGQGGMGG